MEQLLQSLNVMLLGMCGILFVRRVLCLACALLTRMLKKLLQNAARPPGRPGGRFDTARICLHRLFQNILTEGCLSGGNNSEIGRVHFTNRQIFGIVIKRIKLACRPVAARCSAGSAGRQAT